MESARGGARSSNPVGNRARVPLRPAVQLQQKDSVVEGRGCYSSRDRRWFRDRSHASSSSEDQKINGRRKRACGQQVVKRGAWLLPCAGTKLTAGRHTQQRGLNIECQIPGEREQGRRRWSVVIGSRSLRGFRQPEPALFCQATALFGARKSGRCADATASPPARPGMRSLPLPARGRSPAAAILFDHGSK